MQTKVCTKCYIEQTVDKFQPNRRYRDGYLSWCKTCMAEYQKNWAEKNRDRTRENSKRSRLADPVKAKDAGKRYAAKYPERRAANTAIMHAVQRGALLAASKHQCTHCGQAAQGYHHWSYLEEHWLDVIPMCNLCHKRLHAGNLQSDIPVPTQ